MFHMRFHVPIATALLINYTRLKTKIISAPCFCTLYENITSRKAAYFSKTYYHTSLQDPKVVSHLTSLGVCHCRKLKTAAFVYPPFVCNSYEVLLKSMKWSGVEMQNTEWSFHKTIFFFWGNFLSKVRRINIKHRK